MSYSTVTLVLLIGIALSSALPDIRLNNEEYVYMRLYPQFAQLFRSTSNKSDTPRDIEQYTFSFSDREFSNIATDTLTVLYTNVTDRLIVRHKSPSFEKVGAQYIYRRDPLEKEGIEIELVNVEDQLFREVKRPNRYFYLTPSADFEYISQMPVSPYYEVTFVCDNTRSKQQKSPTPLLSYVDSTFYWRPRYVIEFNNLDQSNAGILYGYANIYNTGDRTITIEELEFVAGNIRVNGDSSDYITYAPVYKSDSDADTIYTPNMNQRDNGAYVYRSFLTSAFTLPPRSTKTAPFSKRNIDVERFHLYANTFEPTDISGKLLSAYNITSYESYIPSGPASLYVQGRFLGETNLPDLAVGEPYTILFGYDADISYSRKITAIEGDKTTPAMIYHVEYKFKNSATSMDTTIDFTESFGFYKYFDIRNVYPLNEDFGLSKITRNGTDLFAKFLLPHSENQFTLRYDVIVYKNRPVIRRRD